MTTADRIIDAVARAAEIPRQDLIGPRRTDRLAFARFALFKMLQDRGFTLKEIGAACGGRDHSTIIHGLRRYREFEKVRDIFAAAEVQLARGRNTTPEDPHDAGAGASTRLAALVAGADRADSEADCNW